jgi:hypothetical protein
MRKSLFAAAILAALVFTGWTPREASAQIIVYPSINTSPYYGYGYPGYYYGYSYGYPGYRTWSYGWTNPYSTWSGSWYRTYPSYWGGSPYWGGYRRYYRW